jgi:uncharacterized RDD family membrane protein YckC
MSQMPPPPPPPPAGPLPGWGSSPAQGYGSPRRDYAGFGSRLGGALLDGIFYGLITAIGLVPGVVLIVASLSNCDRVNDGNGTTTLDCQPGQLKGGLLLLGIALIALGALVGIILQCKHLATTGQTWGRRIVGIKVVRVDNGQPIGWGRAIGRTLLEGSISGWICYLGFLWMLWDDNKQTWHDKIVGSIVVKA